MTDRAENILSTSFTPWITWLGDDFTGSAAVMEVLTFAGLPSVLFTDIPEPSVAARFAGMYGVGIATTARSQGPKWMAQHLPAPLAWLHALGAPLLHYKICSTFDSAPHMGSIGQAMESALKIIPSVAVPLLTAAPAMRRYQAFGHLYASAPDGVFRLDRHPVMAHHPVTPMAESDLLRHLAAQTSLPSALINLEDLNNNPQTKLQEAIAAGARILSIDSLDPKTEAAAGRLIWENRTLMPLVFGSQGIEYALVRHWQNSGLIAPAPPPPSAGPVDKIAAVSGSVSPVTARQLAWAGQNGFTLLPFDATAVLGDGLAAEEARLIAAAVAAAGQGNSPLVHSAAGTHDPAVSRFRNALATSPLSPEMANQKIGESLGRILDAVLRKTGLRRAVISGGDTSGHGMRQLNLQALVALAPTIPGAALCKAFGTGAHDGLEIALKGGQMGTDDYFGWIRSGGGPCNQG